MWRSPADLSARPVLRSRRRRRSSESRGMLRTTGDATGQVSFHVFSLLRSGDSRWPEGPAIPADRSAASAACPSANRLRNERHRESQDRDGDEDQSELSKAGDDKLGHGLRHGLGLRHRVGDRKRSWLRGRPRPGGGAEIGENLRAKFGREHENELGRERFVGRKLGNGVHVNTSAAVSFRRRMADSASPLDYHR